MEELDVDKHITVRVKNAMCVINLLNFLNIQETDLDKLSIRLGTCLLLFSLMLSESVIDTYLNYYTTMQRLQASVEADALKESNDYKKNSIWQSYR